MNPLSLSPLVVLAYFNANDKIGEIIKGTMLYITYYGFIHSYQNRTESVNSIGSIENRIMNRYGLINLSKIHVNRIEQGESENFLKNSKSADI